MVEKQTIRHKVTGVQYNWRKHVEKEGVGCKESHILAIGDVNQDDPDDDADDDEKAGFRKYLAELRRHVKS